MSYCDSAPQSAEKRPFLRDADTPYRGAGGAVADASGSMLHYNNLLYRVLFVVAWGPYIPYIFIPNSLQVGQYTKRQY